MHHGARRAARLVERGVQRHFLGRRVAGHQPPAGPSFDSRAGSRKPSEALVGVTSQPPSSSLTLILPEEPGVSPRSNSERPKRQISSRRLVSVMRHPRFCFSLSHALAARPSRDTQRQAATIAAGTRQGKRRMSESRKTAHGRDRARLDGDRHGDVAAPRGFWCGLRRRADRVARVVADRARARRRRPRIAAKGAEVSCHRRRERRADRGGALRAGGGCLDALAKCRRHLLRDDVAGGRAGGLLQRVEAGGSSTSTRRSAAARSAPPRAS